MCIDFIKTYLYYYIHEVLTTTGHNLPRIYLKIIFITENSV